MVTIISFSPTGGTLKYAKITAKELSKGNPISYIDLTDKNLPFEAIQLNKTDMAVIALPSYAGRAPEAAISRLRRIRGNGAKAICIAVYGNRAQEDTLLEISDTAALADFKVIAGIEAVAEHSIARVYAKGRPDKEDEEKLKDFAAKIADNAEEGEIIIPGNRPYKEAKPIPIIPQTENSCISCGLCVKSCPVGAIDNQEKAKTIPEKCISCMRCITICPQKARRVRDSEIKGIEMKLSSICTERKEAVLYLNMSKRGCYV